MNISPFRLQDPHLKKEDGLEFYLGGSVPIPFPQDVISSLPMARTPWPGSSCSLPQKSKQSTYMQIIELQTSFWFSSWGARCLGDDIRSKGGALEMTPAGKATSFSPEARRSQGMIPNPIVTI